MTPYSALFLIICVASMAPRVSVAQTKTDDARISEARTLFEHGRDKLDANAPGEAVTDFERSLALVERSATRFNLAIALCKNGQYVEGIEHYEILLRTTDLEPDKRNEVIKRKAEAETQLSRIALTNRSPRQLTVFVDSAERATLPPTRTIVVAVNPGVHEVYGQSATGRTQPQVLETHSGRTTSHSFEFESPRRDVTPSRNTAPNEVDHTLIASDTSAESLDDTDSDTLVWPWIVLGVVAAGGATVAVLVLTDAGDDESFDARAETLGFRF